VILALDTSSAALSCALFDSAVVAESLLRERHGEALPGALLELCARAGKSLDDVTGLAVGLGPGSFTGLRVGLAAAKALAYARRLPIAGVSSLRALARAFAAPGRIVVPTLEARKGELYAAAFRGDEQLWPAAAMRGPRFIELMRTLPDPLIVGPGAAALGLASVADPPPARIVAELCAPLLAGARYDQAACFALQPDYVKPSEAEVALAEGRVGWLPGR